MKTRLAIVSTALLMAAALGSALAAQPAVSPAGATPAAAAPAAAPSQGGTATDKADKAQIDTACAADAKTAGCGSEVVGKGLLKCMGAYKKANPSFKHTPQCEAAIKQLEADKKAGK